MRVASCKLKNEEYEAFSNWCQSNNTSINETLGNLVREIVEGKVKPHPTGLEDRIVFCPKCGHAVHLIQDDSEFYFWCHHCDWCAFIGEFTLPKDIEDWTEKIQEV